MKTVLVYASNVLPWSETFIKEQILSLRRWRGVLVGMHRAGQLPLDELDVRILGRDRTTLLERVRRRIHKDAGAIPRSAAGRLKGEQASVLHAHFGVEAVKAWPLAQALDLAMVVTLHGYDINIEREWWEAGHGGRGMRKYPEKLLELASQPRVTFVGVSEAVRERALSYGIPRDKVVVRPIGIDTAKFMPRGCPVAERRRRVLFVGRLVEKKGCEYLIRAFAKLRREVPETSLIIVGDGPLRGRLQDLADEVAVPAEFLGAQPTSRIVHELELARVLCLPSVTAGNGDAEGFGLVLLEAQASGVPVVTSARGGAAEGIREGITGFGVRERDIDGLAARLIQLLVDDRLAHALSMAGPRFVAEHFDLPHCTAALEALYESVLMN
jgi:glycosyltransferase involved in cell wall biosynthesis